MLAQLVQRSLKDDFSARRPMAGAEVHHLVRRADDAPCVVLCPLRQAGDCVGILNSQHLLGCGDLFVGGTAIPEDDVTLQHAQP